MSSIVFTPSTGAPITIVGNIVYGSDHYTVRLNQMKHTAVDGTDTVYDSGPNKKYGNLIIKHVSYSDGEAFRTWLNTVLIFMKYTFTLGALTNVDMGSGKNTQVTGCRLLEADDKKVFEFIAPGYYNLNIEYSY